MSELSNLGKKFNTDKEYDHSFCNFYENHLSSVRYQNLKILELGIWDGASLKMWKEYFPNSSIFGVDINPIKVINEDRIKTFIFNAGDENLLSNFNKIYGPFDIVIDDASHFTNHQWVSWRVFSENCKIFIWEDLHTSRISHYITGVGLEGLLPLDYAKKLSLSNDNCYLFDKDNDEKHVTFLKINK